MSRSNRLRFVDHRLSLRLTLGYNDHLLLILALRWLLVAAILAALVAFLYSRTWRVFPCFTAYLLIAGTAAATHVRMEQWPGSSWLHWQYILVGLRVACAVEILFRLTSDDKDRWPIRGGVLLFPGAAVFLAWRVADAMAIPRIARSIGHIEVGIVGMLLLVLLLPLSLAGPYRRHAWLYLVLMTNQLWQLLLWESVPLDRSQWQTVNAIYTAIAILCATGWALLTPATGAPSGAVSIRDPAA